MKKKSVTFLEPSKQQLNDLLKYYQTKQYDNAEKIAVSITEEFPKHPFSWKVLASTTPFESLSIFSALAPKILKTFSHLITESDINTF